MDEGRTISGKAGDHGAAAMEDPKRFCGARTRPGESGKARHSLYGAERKRRQRSSLVVLDSVQTRRTAAEPGF